MASARRAPPAWSLRPAWTTRAAVAATTSSTARTSRVSTRRTHRPAPRWRSATAHRQLRLADHPGGRALQDPAVQPALRQRHALRRPGPPALALGRLPRPRLVEVELGQQLVQGCEGLDEGQLGTQVLSDTEALEVPGDVLADVAAALELVAVVVREQLGVAAHRGRHLGQPRPHTHRTAGERGGEVGEQPGPPQAATADHHAVAPRLPDHLQRVVRAPDVAVAEHGDARDGLLE